MKPRNNLHIFEVRIKYLNCYYGSLFRFYPLSVIWNTTFWTQSDRIGIFLLWRLLCSGIWCHVVRCMEGAGSSEMLIFIDQIAGHHILEDSKLQTQLWKPQCLLLLTKLQKVIISFIKSVSLSVCSHGTTLLPMTRFSWYLIYKYFLTICHEKWNFIKIWQE